jgi:drug/metabolite transporter (DMT)-like permease
MSSVMTFSYLVLLFVGIIFTPDFEFSLNSSIGALGFFTSGYYPYVLLLVGLIGGALVYISYGMSLRYFSPLVVCTALLFEPMLSQIFGSFLNLGKMPGLLTLFGTIFVMVGLYYVGLGGQKKTQITGEL